MDERAHKNGEDDDRPFDLSRPAAGEPVAGGSDNGDEEVAAQRKTVAREQGEAAAGEATAARGEAAREPVAAELPLPLLHELEQPPPVREPQPGDVEPGPPEPAQEEGPARRLPESWRMDLKWIFGIPATIILTLTIAAFVLFRISGEAPSEEIIESTRQQIIADESFREEVAAVDPRLLELLESDELAATLYEDPALLQSAVDEVPEVDEDDPLAQEREYVTTALSIYASLSGTVGENERVEARSALIILLLLLALFGIPYIIFSRRIGKLVSVAVSFAIASWIPLLMLVYLRGGLSDLIVDRIEVEGDARTGFIAGLVDAYADKLVDAAMPVYRFFAIMALVLLGFALLGLLVVWWRFDESLTPRKKTFRL